MTLVKLHCARCGKVLATFDEPPKRWSGDFTFTRCTKCDLPSVDRIVDVLIASDMDSFPAAFIIPNRTVGKLCQKALTTRKTQHLDIRVTDNGVLS